MDHTNNFVKWQNNKPLKIRDRTLHFTEVLHLNLRFSSDFPYFIFSWSALKGQFFRRRPTITVVCIFLEGRTHTISTLLLPMKFDGFWISIHPWKFLPVRAVPTLAALSFFQFLAEKEDFGNDLLKWFARVCLFVPLESRNTAQFFLLKLLIPCKKIVGGDWVQGLQVPFT